MSEEQDRRLGTVVICTALELEYTAVRDHLAPPFAEREERGALYEVAQFRTPFGWWTVALTQTGAGNVQAGVQLERAIAVFHPQVVLFVGVAGGRKDVALGDVVIADAVYDYESGKDIATDYLPRIKTAAPAYRLVQRAAAVARQDQWQHRIPPADGVGGEHDSGQDPASRPRALVKPIAAGSKVVADQRSRIAQLLERHCGDAVAVEMEGHGFLHGAYVNADAGVDALVVRGISDLLSGKTETADEHWQPAAARHAAAYTFELLTRLPPRRTGRSKGKIPKYWLIAMLPLAVAALVLLVVYGPFSTDSVAIRQGLPAERDSTSECMPSSACVHPAPNLSGPWTNPLRDTNADLSQFSALSLAESVENNRASCPVSFYSERNYTGPSFLLRPFEWANLSGTVWYHHLQSNRWAC